MDFIHLTSLKVQARNDNRNICNIYTSSILIGYRFINKHVNSSESSPICQLVQLSEDYIAQYTHIRLAALKTNPEAFGSTYVGESAFSREQWRRRVDNPARTTLFASTTPSVIASASLEREVGLHHHESKWIGTLSLLGPEMLRGVPFPPRIMEAEERGDAEIYMLTGMWVHPDFRKKGVGRQLVEHALQTLRDFSVADNGREDRNGEWNKGRQKKLLLEVHETNVEAQRLYETLGFVEEPEDSKEGKRWLALTVT